jgi:hypothetical protein
MQPINRSVIDALEAEWPIVATSTHATTRLKEWALLEPDLVGFNSLMAAVRVVHDADQQQSAPVARALVRLAGHDDLARRAVLQMMVPVMCRRVQWLRSWGRSVGVEADLDEASQTVVAATVEVISRVGGRTVAWPITHLRSKLRKSLFQLADRDARQRLGICELDFDHPAPAPSGLPELEDVLIFATRTGVVSQQDAALVWMTRVGGWDTAELTDQFGGTPKTLLKRRERAEHALGRVA